MTNLIKEMNDNNVIKGKANFRKKLHNKIKFLKSPFISQLKYI